MDKSLENLKAQAESQLSTLSQGMAGNLLAVGQYLEKKQRGEAASWGPVRDELSQNLEAIAKAKLAAVAASFFKKL